MFIGVIYAWDYDIRFSSFYCIFIISEIFRLFFKFGTFKRDLNICRDIYRHLRSSGVEFSN